MGTSCIPARQVTDGNSFGYTMIVVWRSAGPIHEFCSQTKGHMNRLLLFSLALLVSFAAQGQNSGWERLDQGFGLDSGSYITNFVVYDGSSMFAAVISGNMRVFTSADEGSTWAEETRFPRQRGTAAFMAALAPGEIALGALGSGGVFLVETRDNGATWLERTFPGLGSPLSLVQSGDLRLMGTASGIGRSTDHGDSYTLVQGSPASVRQMFVDGNNVIAANGSGFLFRSGDGGQTWQEVLPDGTASTRISRGLWREAGRVYSIDIFNNRYVTSDYGATWTADGTIDLAFINGVTPGSRANETAIFLSGTDLYAATGGSALQQLPAGAIVNGNGSYCAAFYTTTQSYLITHAWGCFDVNNGIYRQRIGNSSTRNLISEVALGLSPNPAADHISLSIPSDLTFYGEADLQILDGFGREVLGQKIPAHGGSTIDLDLQHLPAGWYTVYLKGGKEIRTGRVLLTK